MTKTMTTQGATAKFRRLVRSRMKRGMTRAAATKETARRNPRLHGLTILEANRGKCHAARNDVRDRFGLRAKSKAEDLLDNEEFRELVEQFMEEGLSRSEAIREATQEMPELFPESNPTRTRC